LSRRELSGIEWVEVSGDVMQGSDHVGPLTKRQDGFVAVLAVLFLLVFVCASALAQINGTPPSVTSLPLSHFLPNPPGSITSLGPFGFGHGVPSNLGTAPNLRNFPVRQFPYNRQFGHGRGQGAYSYSIPYYVPYDTSGYGYDYVAGSDTYSGPPNGPSEPVLHIVVEQPPALPPQAYREHVTADSNPPRFPQQAEEPPAPAVADSRPGDPTVLVFRDGRKQEISNYAIMGQVVYVFDEHNKKIPLADLDVAATVKANDDRGLEFKVPQAMPAKKKDSSIPRQNAPVAPSEKPRDVAEMVVP
jgi:hypothetical protein